MNANVNVRIDGDGQSYSAEWRDCETHYIACVTDNLDGLAAELSKMIEEIKAKDLEPNLFDAIVIVRKRSYAKVQRIPAPGGS